MARATYICSHNGCSAYFSKSSRLKVHLLSHNEERPFKCGHEGCMATFKRPHHLKRHEETHKSQSFECTIEGCDKTFSSLHTLEKHEKRAHSELKQFQCSTCKKRFAKHQQLTVHEYQHTLVKPYKCTIEGCDQAFVIPAHLKRHLKYHKGYKCKQENCSETFDKWTLYRKHQKLCHPPEHKCNICQKIFRKKCNLKQHLEYHESNKKTISCPYENCCREYLLEKSLKQHIRCSHEEPKFICTFEGCDKKYKHKKSLKKHSHEHEPGGYQNKSKKSTTKEKKRYKYHKHKSMASTLAEYKPSLEEERAILSKDKEFVKNQLIETVQELSVSKSDVLNVREKVESEKNSKLNEIIETNNEVICQC